MKIITALIAFTGLAAMQLSYAATPTTQSNPFEGAYGQIGVGYETTKVSFTGGQYDGTHPYTASMPDTNGFATTLTGGYNFAINESLVLGLGAEYMPLHGKKSTATAVIPSVGTATSEVYKKNAYNIFVSPGFLINKDALAYAKIGYTGTDIDVSGTKESYKGYSLGLGYKQFINQSVYGFGEINYAKYDSKSDSTGFTGTNAPSVTNFLVGIGLKF